jgi:hypothetical protein
MRIRPRTLTVAAAAFTTRSFSLARKAQADGPMFCGATIFLC